MSIASNIESIKNQLPRGCKLIAVTKTHGIEVLKETYDTGHKVFGENKVQEMVEKYEQLPKDIEWHLIGHLQSNKVKYIAPFVAMIHSIDSVKLLSEVDKQARKVNRSVDCLLQVHIASEETKFGFSKDELTKLLQSKALEQFLNVKIVGLMGMATNTDDQDLIRKEFRTLKALYDSFKVVKTINVNFSELSMGMSSDYLLAISEGSTMVRVGSAIFGGRNYNK